MFILFGPLALAAGSAAVGAASSLFGKKPPTIGEAMKAINEQRPKYGSPAWPTFNTSIPGGANVASGENTSYNLKGTGINKLINQGKYGHGLTSQQKQAIASNPYQVDSSNLTPFLINKLKSKGKTGTKTPFFDVTPDTDAQTAFDKLQEGYLSQIDEQKRINAQITNSLLPSLLGFQNKAIGQADKLSDQLTDLSPFAQEQINKAQQGFMDAGSIGLDRDLESSLENAKAILSDSGIPLGRSSDGGLFLERSALRPNADARAMLRAQSQQFGHQMSQDWLGNRRNAYGALLQSPGMNNAISGLNAPGLPMNPFLMNPTGLYDPNFILGANQFNSNYGLNRDQMIQGNFNASIPGALGAASQPGRGAAFGSVLGNVGGTAASLGLTKYLFPDAYSGAGGSGYTPYAPGGLPGPYSYGKR